MPESPAATSPCPDENEIAWLLQGELDEARIRSLETHLDRCPSCADLVVELTQLFFDPGDDEPSELVSGLLGRYQILEPIAMGGMGIVAVGYDPRLKRKVALKLIRPELLESDQGENITERLVREAQLLASLAHPNVVTVFDVGTVEDRVFMAAEYVQGSTLTDWIRQERPSGAEILEAFAQAGQGLAAAHQAGLVHRDVKPRNILMGTDGRVRVTDFGLAVVAGRSAGMDPLEETELSPRTAVELSVSLTASGAVLGTPAYMAPEQISGGAVDARSDQFSYCVSLYQALCGALPFAGSSLKERAASIQQGVLPFVARSGIPPLVRQAISRGLKADPEERFPSMTALLSQLEWGRAQGSQRRARTAVAWVGGLTLVTILALGLWLWFLLRPGTISSPAVSPPGKGTSARAPAPAQMRPQPRRQARARPRRPRVVRPLPRANPIGRRHKYVRQKPDKQRPKRASRVQKRPKGTLQVVCKTPMTMNLAGRRFYDTRTATVVIKPGRAWIEIHDPGTKRWHKFHVEIKVDQTTRFKCPPGLSRFTCPEEVCPRTAK